MYQPNQLRYLGAPANHPLVQRFSKKKKRKKKSYLEFELKILKCKLEFKKKKKNINKYSILCVVDSILCIIIN